MNLKENFRNGTDWYFLERHLDKYSILDTIALIDYAIAEASLQLSKNGEEVPRFNDFDFSECEFDAEDIESEETIIATLKNYILETLKYNISNEEFKKILNNKSDTYELVTNIPKRHLPGVVTTVIVKNKESNKLYKIHDIDEDCRRYLWEVEKHVTMTTSYELKK